MIGADEPRHALPIIVAAMRLRKKSMRGPLRFEAFGVGLQVEFGSDELRAIADAVLPPNYSPCEPSEVRAGFTLSGSEAEGYSVGVAGRPTLTHGTLAVALNALDADIRMFIAVNAKELFVHAGVVGINGACLVIPGETFTGKTTLVSALVQAGATYFSDEYAVLDDTGRVHPYARRLSIRGELGKVHDQAVDELGGSAATAAAEVGAVLVTRYKPNTEWRPQRISAGEAALALLANTLPARDRPEQALHAVSRAVAGAILLKGDRGDARETVPALLAELSKFVEPGDAR
jgi:hypothetical protein